MSWKNKNLVTITLFCAITAIDNVDFQEEKFDTYRNSKWNSYVPARNEV